MKSFPVIDFNIEQVTGIESRVLTLLFFLFFLYKSLGSS